MISLSNRIIPLCVVIGALAPAFAAGGECHPQDANTQHEMPEQGLRAFVDPETGELTHTPPPGEEPDLPQSRSSVEDPEVRFEQLEGGEVAADVGDRFHRDLRVEIVDGELITCHTDRTSEG